MTLKITPTVAAKTPWTLANDAQPCSHFSSECTHFEFEKLKWDKKLALGLKGRLQIASVTGSTEGTSASHSERGIWFPLPRRRVHFFLNCKDPPQVTPSPWKADVRSLLRHKEFCCLDLLEMQEQTGRLKIGNSMHHPLSSFLSTAPLSVGFGTHAGKKYFPLIVWASVLDQCTAFQELWDPKHV